MKKLLGLFSSIGLTATGATTLTNVIACSSFELPDFPKSRSEAISIATAHQNNFTRINKELDQSLHYESNASRAKKDDNYQEWLIEVFWYNAYITIANVYNGFEASAEVSQLRTSNNSFILWASSSTESANGKILKWLEKDIYNI